MEKIKTIKNFEGENIEVSKFGEWIGKDYIDYKFEYENYQRILADSISKSVIRDFFRERLLKYQEADDGRYDKPYLTRGELELVDRYGECKEIAEILLAEKIELPKECISKDRIRDKIEELVNKIDGTNKGFIYACEVDLLEELIGEVSKTKQEYWNKYDD